MLHAKRRTHEYVQESTESETKSDEDVALRCDGDDDDHSPAAHPSKAVPTAADKADASSFKLTHEEPADTQARGDGDAAVAKTSAIKNIQKAVN